MGIVGDNTRPRGSFLRGLIYTLLLSVLLGWIPLAGALIAGLAGGRAARRPVAAFFAGLIPGLVWGGLFVWLSHQEIRVGNQTVVAGPLFYYGPLVASALTGGALMGAAGFLPKVIGLAVVAAGLYYFVPNARTVRDTLLAFAPANHAPAQTQPASCPENLAQIYKAMQFYMDDWDGRLPPAERWMDCIRDRVPRDEAFHCPALGPASGTRYGYSMNPALGGKAPAALHGAATTPLIYDSVDLSANAHADFASLPKPGRHDGRDYVLYADGTVKAVSPP
ncbi:MAG: hypothetical protein ACP5VE_13420 [Chthonomonadales bacterium]